MEASTSTGSRACCRIGGTCSPFPPQKPMCRQTLGDRWREPFILPCRDSDPLGHLSGALLLRGVVAGLGGLRGCGASQVPEHRQHRLHARRFARLRHYRIPFHPFVGGCSEAPDLSLTSCIRTANTDAIWLGIKVVLVRCPRTKMHSQGTPARACFGFDQVPYQGRTTRSVRPDRALSRTASNPVPRERREED